MVGEPQPSTLPSIKAYVSASSPPIASTWPSTSGRRAIGLRESASQRDPSARAATPIGRLTRKIEGQPAAWTRTPPTIEPAAIAMPEMPAHRPSACTRWRGSANADAISDRLPGASAAPPAPWSARPAIRDGRSVATPHIAEPAVKMASPKRKSFLRPNRSPSVPAVSNRTANGSV
jgi:hypothetical protein